MILIRDYEKMYNSLINEIYEMYQQQKYWKNLANVNAIPYEFEIKTDIEKIVDKIELIEKNN